jgi:hypothetical protein
VIDDGRTVGEKVMDGFKDITANIVCAVLGAGGMALIFTLYLIPKRDEIKDAANKLNFFKLLKDMESQRKEHELALSRLKAEYEVALKEAKKKVDPVAFMNDVARGE